jgi:hypothetical protein
MSLSERYSNNCLHFSKRAVPLVPLKVAKFFISTSCTGAYVLGKPFQPSLMFASKVEANPSGAPEIFFSSRVNSYPYPPKFD